MKANSTKEASLSKEVDVIATKVQNMMDLACPKTLKQERSSLTRKWTSTGSKEVTRNKVSQT